MSENNKEKNRERETETENEAWLTIACVAAIEERGQDPL